MEAQANGTRRCSTYASAQRWAVARTGAGVEGDVTDISETRLMMARKERRWALSILGNPVDLGDAIHLFGRAGRFEVATLEANGRSHTAIFADALDAASGRDEVRDLGGRLVGHLSGALFALDPERSPLTADEVLERSADGTWARAPASLRGHVAVRSRMKGRLTAIGQDGQPVPTAPPLHGDLLAESLGDEPMGDVLEFLKGEPGWFELYKAFERMRDDAKRRAGQRDWQKIGGLGWPPKHEVDFFTESAQVHRHSRAKWDRYDLCTAMPLEEARRYVARLAEAWLKWRCAPADRTSDGAKRR